MWTRFVDLREGVCRKSGYNTLWEKQPISTISLNKTYWITWYDLYKCFMDWNVNHIVTAGSEIERAINLYI